MRKLFFDYLCKTMEKDDNIVVLTGDLGYGLLDKIRNTHTNRFFNVLSSEQLMIGMAVGMTMEGKIVVCYSITSFLLYRPFEFIRNYLGHDKIPVKLVGGGRDKDYGYLGFTHWAEEDVDVCMCVNGLQIYKPDTDRALLSYYDTFLYNKQPAYLNLKK